MYLPIDSNYDGFQLIHFDLKHGYGIQCKFKFYKNANGEEAFDITHYRRFVHTEQGAVYQSIGCIGRTQESNSSKYGYIINIDLPPGEFDMSESRTECHDCRHVKKPENQKEVKKENIIDIHIERAGNIPTSFYYHENQSQGDDSVLDIKTKHGSGICLCYIV